MSHRVRLQPSGHEFLTEAGETILDAALRQGFVMTYSCRGGTCGSCKGRLLSGEVDYGGHDTPALSEQERKDGKALFCRATPVSDVVIEAQEIAAIRGIIIRTLPCRVVSMQRLAPDVMALRLKLPQSEKFHFMAGQYIDILLPGGRRRSYSIASAPHDDEFLQLHIRHLPGGLFSGQVFDRMQEKDLLRFRGPLGTFFLREDSARPLILVAGGTGFAPMKSIIEHMLHGGMKRPVHLYWGGRTPHDLYMHDLAQSWTRATDLLRYTPVLSQPVTGDNWQGRTGLAHEAVVQDYPDLSGYDIYASGPPAMIGSARQAFTGRGLPDAAFFSDSFEHARDGAQDTG